MLTLHHSPFSVSSQKVRLVLAEKGLSWTDRIVDLLVGEQFRDEFRQLNARTEVPVLEHDGLVLTESWLIGEYLDEVFPQAPLMPVRATDRHGARLWNQWIERHIHQASGMLTYAVLARPLLAQQSPESLDVLFQKLPESEARAWRRSVIAHGLGAPEMTACICAHRALFEHMERSLHDEQAWLSGPAFSMADIAALPYVMRADHLGLRGLMSAGAYPKLHSWYARTLVRPTMHESFNRYVGSDMQALLTQLVSASRHDLDVLVRSTE
jgi:glutathione S-transferase